MARTWRTWRKQEEEGPSSSDYRDQGPPSTRDGQPTEDGRFLGVPDDYTTPRIRGQASFRGMSPRAVEGWTGQGAGPGTVSRNTTPRYRAGDEWRPASWGPEAVMATQRALMAAGLLDPNDGIRLGAWDARTREAYTQAMGEANASGLDVEELLIEREQQTAGIGGEGGEGGGGGRWELDENGNLVFVPEQFVPPDALPLKLPSREDMRAVTRSAVIEALGQGWSQGEIDAFVDRYYSHAEGLAQQAHDAEVGRQRQAWETGQPISDVNVQLDIPNPEAALDEELRRTQPDAYGAGQIASTFAPEFFAALGGYT